MSSSILADLLGIGEPSCALRLVVHGHILGQLRCLGGYDSA